MTKLSYNMSRSYKSYIKHRIHLQADNTMVHITVHWKVLLSEITVISMMKDKSAVKDHGFFLQQTPNMTKCKNLLDLLPNETG
jgi:hypothetical protein